MYLRTLYSVYTYTWQLARAPLLLLLSCLRSWDMGFLLSGHGRYPAALGAHPVSVALRARLLIAR